MADTKLYCPVLEERKKFRDYRREVWGDSFNWWKERSWETIKYLVIHHSVTNPTSDPKSDVDYIAQIHKNNDWGGIGYHFVITADGMVWYVGDISTQRANVADKNHLVIGICLVGDFTKSNPTDEQILSAHDLCKFFLNDVQALPNICGKGWDVVVGHKELQATQCPGTYWKGVGDSMFERIKNRIPYTPQSQPEPVINWEKRYSDLKTEKEVEVKRILGEKEGLTSKITQLAKDLANYKLECEGKITDLEEKLENAELENPKIPDIEEYDNSKVLGRAFDIIIEKIKGKIPFITKKQKT